MANLRTARLVVGAMVMTWGCTDPTSPYQDAVITATLTDGQMAAQALRVAGFGPEAMAVLEGTLSGAAAVSVYREPGGWTSLGEPKDVSIPLQSGAPATIASDAVVSAGTYTQVRLRLEGFQADLSAASIVEGAELTSGVSLMVGGRDNVMEIQMEITPITITSKIDGRLDFDLASGKWVTARTIEDLVVFDDEVKAAASVRAHTSG